MKKLSIAILSLAVVACGTKGGNVPAKVPAFNKAEVIGNEFIFSGDPTPVREYLGERGLKASFEQLNEKFHAVKYAGETSLHEVMTDLAAVTETIEPNRIMSIQSVLNKGEWPNDRMFFKQWGLNNIGQSPPFGIPGTRGADMDILAAHEKTLGTANVLVGVVDSGCDYTHPDIKDAFAVNEKEAPANGGVAGVDDDGNGYTDDVYGLNTVSGELQSTHYGFPGTPDPMDDHSHGTHCTGAIVAQKNNGIGVVGVAPGVKIVCAKIGNAQGQISTKDAFRGIRYLRDRKVHIMTNSWGGNGHYDSSLLHSEILEVEKARILFVVAAGNDSRNIDVAPTYPASLKFMGRKEGKFKNVLVVGASDNQDNPAFFSNYGSESVDVFAPGVAILSTVPGDKESSETGAYGVMSGTSMATPYVTGVAALLMSYNPSLMNQPEEVIRLINQTADLKDSLVGKSISNGRINATRALERSVNKDNENIQWLSQGFSLSQRGFNKELMDVRHEIKSPGAKQMKVHFNFIDIEAPDSVYIYDKNLRLITEIDRTDTTDYWSPTIPGDVVYVRFVNAKVQQVKMSFSLEKTELACSSKGARNIERRDADQYACLTDSSDSSGAGSDIFNTFNSEGFSIDQIAYVPGDTKVAKE